MMRRRLTAGTLALFLVVPGLASAAAQANFARVDGIALAAHEDKLVSAVIDPEGAYAYFGTFPGVSADTVSGEVVKVDLDTFKRVGALSFDGSVEAGTETAATEGALIDPDGTYAYFMTTFGPSLGRVIRIDLATFSRAGNLDLDTGWVRAAVMDPEGRFAYLARDVGGPDSLDKIDLQTFEHVATIDLPDGIVTSAAVMDPDGRYAVFAQEGDPSYLHRVDLETFTIDRTLTYDPGDPGAWPDSAVVDPAGEFVYVGTGTHPGVVVKIDLATFSQVGLLEMPVGDGALETAVIDGDGRYAYFGEGDTLAGDLIRVDLATFTRAGSIHFADPEMNPISSVIAPNGRYAYFGTETEPGRVVKVDLDAPEAAGTHRVSGGDRFETAAQIALARFDPDQTDLVFLAVGADFPDALAGGPLAAFRNAPILLAQRDSLPNDTREALATLQPGRVIALGGTAAVSNAVLADAAGAAGGATTGRLSGDNRYATAATIAAQLPSTGNVYLATGSNFPDALAGGAAADGSPILLATPTSLPGPTETFLAERRPSRVIALGGPSAVSDQVLAAAARAAGGATTSRLSGDNRYATAVAIADTLPTPDTVYVATGVGFPDALAGGPAAVAEEAPILLVTRDTIPGPIAEYLAGLPGLRRIVILGGTAAVSVQVADQLHGYTTR